MPKKTLVEEIFGGKIISTITCGTCDYSQHVPEPFLDLSLQIPIACLSQRQRELFDHRPRGKPATAPKYEEGDGGREERSGEEGEGKGV
jgi:hypothetical protein